LLALTQHTGANGRFGLAVYTVHLPPGVDVLPRPCAAPPHAAPPCAVMADAANTKTAAERARRDRPGRKRAEQGRLDLGWAPDESPSFRLPAALASVCGDFIVSGGTFVLTVTALTDGEYLPSSGLRGQAHSDRPHLDCCPKLGQRRVDCRARLL